VAELRRADLAEDPLEQFRRWFEEARPVVRLPEAMAVATAAPDGGPSVRMLLLKAADERGFVFFTGYVSRKGAELDANPRAALLFYWDPLGRQVRVEGTVQRVPAAESRQARRSVRSRAPLRRARSVSPTHGSLNAGPFRRSRRQRSRSRRSAAHFSRCHGRACRSSRPRSSRSPPHSGPNVLGRSDVTIAWPTAYRRWPSSEMLHPS
jgi:hypothetical protein